MTSTISAVRASRRGCTAVRLVVMLCGILGACLVARSEAAEVHTALIADFTTNPAHFPGGPNVLRLVDMDTGKTLGEATIGVNPDLALSSDGSVVAVVSRFVVDGVREPTDQLQLFRTTDLTAIARGYLPFDDRRLSQRVADLGVVAFADGDRVLLIPRTFSPADQPHLAGRRIRWTCIDLAGSLALMQAGGLDGALFIQSSHPDVIGGNGIRLPFLSTGNWPFVLTWLRDIDPVTRQRANLIQILDFQQGEVFDQVRASPTAVPEQGGQAAAPALGTLLVTPGGASAYFLPDAPFRLSVAAQPQDRGTSGYICRYSLVGDRPQLAQQGAEAVADLDPGYSDVSEAAGALAVAFDHPYPASARPRKFRVYDTTTFKPRGEVDTSMEFTQLAFSRDGSQIYAAQSGRGKGTIKVYRTSDLSLQHELEDLYTELAVLVPLPGPKAGR